MQWSRGEDEREGEKTAIASLLGIVPSSDAPDVFGDRLDSNGKCFMNADRDAGRLLLNVLCLLGTCVENLRACLRKHPLATTLPLTDLPPVPFGEVWLTLFVDRRLFPVAGGAAELVEGKCPPAALSRSSLIGAASCPLPLLLVVVLPPDD